LQAPLLMFHGTNDTILPPQTSEVVRMIAGKGELVMLDGDDHLLSQSHDVMRERLLEWIPAQLA
jgi:alpha-beta hydrolase superfamily lysophospholipase